MYRQTTVQTVKQEPKNVWCRACGKERIKPGRRYCSAECRRHILWVLSLSKGLLRIFNARYASFSFDKCHVILDILPIWSTDISRFVLGRTIGKKPATDLKELILRSGEEWYTIINDKNSKSYASLLLLNKNHNSAIPPDSIKPCNRLRPRFTKCERESVKLLRLELNELISVDQIGKIKSAYKKRAKILH